MSGFNADAFRAAHRPWSFTVGGRTYLARHVSAPQTQAFEDAMRAAAKDPRKERAAAWRVLRLAFPWRLSYLFRGDPVRIILHELEPAARQAALSDFFVCLWGLIPTPLQKKTNGTHSPARTQRQRA